MISAKVENSPPPLWPECAQNLEFDGDTPMVAYEPPVLAPSSADLLTFEDIFPGLLDGKTTTAVDVIQDAAGVSEESSSKAIGKYRNAII